MGVRAAVLVKYCLHAAIPLQSHHLIQYWCSLIDNYRHHMLLKQ